ncbi:LysR family hydrogen peroxide-inducible transcriptional activator [Kitasatospora sp. MAP12-15]|uniref:LysR substrate-binding domain-containing protein n=1 Tax=unclassified Kitasatospora TaxID=2633591 RepID=UPI002473DD3C|nr:LysR substrate-binding domain-containing protein [Kitasatospora sp. MAP12-44]MDH6112584.1 LysR family hydrogen peroxide-inducible transcriptional activator [Kitasatospora sp. MAP12-44]
MASATARATRTPTVSQLRAFVAVAEHRHFRDAAAAIGTSQPALSGAVAALEEALGAQLVERTTRKVIITSLGERVAEHARRVLGALQDLTGEVEAARRPFTGPLHLGVIPTVAPYLLPAVLRLVRDGYPDLELHVHEERTPSLLEGLAAGRLDLLLLALPAGGSSPTRDIPLFDEDFVLVTPPEHALAGRVDVPRDVLLDLDVLLLEEGHCLRDQALDLCREVGAEAGGGSTRAAGLSTLVQLVAGGLGVTLLPATALEVEAGRTDRLAAVHFSAPAPGRRIGLATRPGSARSAEYDRFADSLREVLADLPVRIVS